MIRLLFALMTIMFLVGEAVSKTASLPRRHVIEIREFSFFPHRIVVAPGDTIVWVNRDIVPHTITANSGMWRSQALEEGQTWEVVIEIHGHIGYFCEFHPHMTGVLASRS